MKNIHIIPTYKPSRLVYNSTTEKYDLYSIKVLSSQNQNIYITNSEEIKERDWFLYGKNLGKSRGCVLDDSEKIILTTNPDLIKDGVQAIPDEFLEWFVKNPSCEEVELICSGRNCIEEFGCTKEICNGVKPLKIIIPSEESKQDFILVKEDCPCTDECMYYLTKQCKHLKEEPKQETLEEAAKEFSKQFLNNGENSEFEAQASYLGFIACAKWQQERSYSKEEVLSLIQFLSDNNEFKKLFSISKDSAKYFFERFKKK